MAFVSSLVNTHKALLAPATLGAVNLILLLVFKSQITSDAYEQGLYVDFKYGYYLTLLMIIASDLYSGYLYFTENESTYET